MASGVAAVMVASTKSLTDFTVGYFVLDVPSALTSVLLLDKFSFNPKRVIKVAVSAIRDTIFALLSIIAALYTNSIFVVSSIFKYGNKKAGISEKLTLLLIAVVFAAILVALTPILKVLLLIFVV